MMTAPGRPASRDLVARGAGVVAGATAVAAASVALVANAVAHLTRLADDVAADSSAVARELEELWDLIRRRLDAAGAAVRATPRFARITAEILRLVTAYRWHHLVSGPRAELLGRAADAAALAALHARSAEHLYELCVELRGGVLKIGQFVSSRMDLLPQAYIAALSRLQDRVPPVPASAIATRIRAELGATPEAIFAGFDSQPIAAASLAQVHAARLADGAQVVVKAQVPGIEGIVETDLAALELMAPALREVLPFADVETVLAEIGRALRAELDYEAEARHAAAFAACFAGDADIVIPRVHARFSSRRVLTLEHVTGARLIEYLDACEGRGEPGARDRDRVFEILLRSYCAQVLTHGLLQADPHPGNFLVEPGENGPRLALLDFGCVQAYAPARRRAYAELALAVLAGDTARLAVLFAAMGFRSRDGSPDALSAFAELMLEAFRADAAFDLQALDARAAFERVVALTRDHPIVAIPTDFVLLARVFAVLGGLLLRYRPRVNLFQIIMPQLLAAQANG